MGPLGGPGSEGESGCLWHGRDRGGAFQYSRRLTRPYGREG